MSDFEKYIEAKYPNRSPKILFQKFKDIDGTLFYGVKEVEDQAEVWSHQQAIIDSLKAQLNNMETCYIEKKKQVEAVEYVLGCAMIGPKEVFQYADTIGKALRGEHD